MSTLALCIPAYQAADYIPRLLISAREQTIPFDEILVYDDASSDSTAAVAEKYGARVLCGASNVGCSAAKNFLLHEAASEWIHFHDADDLLLPNFTTLAHLWITKLACPDVVLFDYLYIDNQSSDLIAQSDFLSDELEEDPLRYAILHQINPFCGLYRKSRLLDVGGYDVDPEILYNEDVAFHCKLALNGLSFSCEKQISIINYRMSESMSGSNQLKCLHSQVEVMRRLSHLVGQRYSNEIASKLWHTAQCLASLQDWHEVSTALTIASSLTTRIPRGQSILFKLLISLLGPVRAFRFREQAIRTFKPWVRLS